MNIHVLAAVFRRNFVSYFASPTGYVFICVFELLSAFAAFLPNEFFNANLANLDQLNYWFPFIMLVFIPAITMSIWADERRQGTDELLLTVPAGDFDIVLGKYLAAVAIFSVALLFSLLCNYAVLAWLGNPDFGLFLGTYVGYWLVGLAMLAIGMMASFLTGNLTVAFVFGALLNVPLVFLVWADAVQSQRTAMALKSWSIGQRLDDFGRGVISLSGLAYFAMIMAVMLYLSMVLIARRHWYSGRKGAGMVGHFVVRTLTLAVIVVGATIVLEHHDLRLDATAERLNSLAPQTRTILAELKPQSPVNIEAFISPVVPEAYVQTRLNLKSMLQELRARGGNNVRVRINDTERFSEQAALAEKLYGIQARRVTTKVRGAYTEDHIFMGVAMTSGLQKVVLPFVERGLPVEYELVRSIATVSQQKRKKVGVVNTDAQLFGRFNFQSMSSGGNWPIVDELEKQYEVVQVDPTQKIDLVETDPQTKKEKRKYDVLLAVQPSSLGPEELDNFLAAVQQGQPTAIFEDPCPLLSQGVPATSMPRQPPGGMNMMMMGGRGAPPKGDVRKLWNVLGIDFSGDQVVWQKYNPYPKTAQVFPDEFVFVDRASKAKFNPDDPISARLQHLLFPFPGSITKLNSSSLEVTPLVKTGEMRTGTVRFSDIMRMTPFGPGGGLNPSRRQIPTDAAYNLAVHIRGKIKPPQLMADEGPPPAKEKPADTAATDKPADKAAEGAAEKPTDTAAEEAGETPVAGPSEKPGEKPAAKTDAKEAAKGAEKKPEEKRPKEAELNVVVVGDVDMLAEDFFRIRERGYVPDEEIHYDFDNVPFVLNVLDGLAGDDRFIELRSRRPKHRTLSRIEERTEDAKTQAAKEREAFSKEFDEAEGREQKAMDEKIDELSKRKDIDPQRMAIELAMTKIDLDRRRQVHVEQEKQKRDREINKIDADLALEVRHVQDQYKLWAVLLPPLPPLALALVVFLTRRAQEREGVARSRLR